MTDWIMMIIIIVLKPGSLPSCLHCRLEYSSSIPELFSPDLLCIAFRLYFVFFWLLIRIHYHLDFSLLLAWRCSHVVECSIVHVFRELSPTADDWYRLLSKGKKSQSQGDRAEFNIRKASTASNGGLFRASAPRFGCLRCLISQQDSVSY